MIQRVLTRTAVILALAVPAAGAVAVAPAIVQPSTVTAEARPVPDGTGYCGPGYYPYEQYGYCKKIVRLQVGKPPIWQVWNWRF